MPFVIVVSGRTLLLKGFCLARLFDNGLNPFLLSRFTGLNTCRIARPDCFQYIGQMNALLIQRISICRREGRLDRAEEKRIRKVFHMHAVKSGNAVTPFLRDGLPADPVYLITRATRIIGSHFKARRENNAVDFVCFTVQYNTLGVDFIDAAPTCINKCDIGTVERLQILIVKTRAFAELTIIGFKRLGRIGIVN